MGEKPNKIDKLLKNIKGLDVEMPERDPEEPDLTAEQFNEIRELTDEVLPDDLVKALGKWQAAHLLLKLKEDELMEGMAETDKYDNKIRMLKNALILSALFFFALLIVSLLLKAFRH
ncbi:MAG TPA: hypothetical protein DET40_14010 [Lentisphaeria bacterium]|nr:MAG: hypothetical protein A2X45_00835 [Lentisphaerae bacterium GWF2_50_93]HCE44653.1 hypothetical protein [Lentisphaeria bacterium]